MPFLPDFPRNSGESKQTGSESSFRLAGVSAPPKTQGPNRMFLAQCQDTKFNHTRCALGTALRTQKGEIRAAVVRHVHAFHFLRRRRQQVDRPRSSLDLTSTPKSRRQPASPTSQPQSRRKMPRSELPPSRPLTGAIATPSSTVSPLGPLPPANREPKKAPVPPRGRQSLLGRRG